MPAQQRIIPEDNWYAHGPRRLTTADQLWIERETRRRCIEWRKPDLTLTQTDQIVALAVDLYATAGGHGVSRDLANGVTSFIDAAIDGIRARDRR